MSNLVENGKYTIVMMGEFGFPLSFNIHFCKTGICDYAQYRNVTYIDFKVKNKRKVTRSYIFPYKMVAIYDGWFDVDTSVFSKIKIDDNGNSFFESKYVSFDDRYIMNIMSKIDKEPILSLMNLKR